MSYARFNCAGSDVYVYGGSHPDDSSKDAIICCWCPMLKDSESFIAGDTSEMIDHLKQHRVAGHVVPEDTFVDLLKEKINA